MLLELCFLNTVQPIIHLLMKTKTLKQRFCFLMYKKNHRWDFFLISLFLSNIQIDLFCAFMLVVTGVSLLDTVEYHLPGY